MTVAQTFQQAENYFFQGKYQEAADLCRSIIHTQPDFARAYYLLGALFKMTGNFEQAIAFSNMAIERDPRDAQFYLQKGHSLLSAGKQEDAENVLKQALTLDKKLTLAHVLLANVAMKRRDFSGAEKLLMEARSIANLPEIEEHLGLCAQLQQNFTKAEDHYRAMIALDTTLGAGYLHLAKLLASQKRAAEAEPFFRQALEKNPNATEALLALANASGQRGEYKEAITLSHRAIQVNPALMAGYVMLGGYLITTGQHGAALPVYEEGLKRDPNNPFLIEGYAKVLMQIGRLQDAKTYIEKVLQLKPHDRNMKYYLDAISGKSPDTAPPEYVAGLFDEYADHFEDHLTKGLRYHTPDEIAAALRNIMVARPEHKGNLSLLDLGCGTGLGTEALKDIADFRVGVDLSAKMIEKSREKNLYNETAVQDITQYMNETPHRFDIIICVDTLVYIGNLKPFFEASARAIKKGGLLAVSVEQGDEAQDFVLKLSTRYGHSEAYLKACASANGFVCQHMKQVELRQDKDGIIKGYVAVFERV